MRVEKALPSLDRYAPVIAFAIAAMVEGMISTFSKPPSMRAAPVVERTVTVAGAPVIAKTASTLPTRSTTAMVARWLRACASATARATMPCTCATLNALAAVAQLPEQSCETGAAGVETRPPPPAVPPPPPQPPINSASAADSIAATRVIRNSP